MWTECVFICTWELPSVMCCSEPSSSTGKLMAQCLAQGHLSSICSVFPRGFRDLTNTLPVTILHFYPLGHNWVMIRIMRCLLSGNGAFIYMSKWLKLFGFYSINSYFNAHVSLWFLLMSLWGRTINQVSLPLPICLYLKDITQFNLVELWQLDILRTHTHTHHITKHWLKMYRRQETAGKNAAWMCVYCRFLPCDMKTRKIMYVFLIMIKLNPLTHNSLKQPYLWILLN